MMKKGFSAGPAAALILLLAAGAAWALTGAIFTTTSTGILVNANIYTAKEDVYLNGGPQPSAPCTAAGLPDGPYYFQVTDPSGATLLSSDAITARQFTVLAGVIVSASSHSTGTGKCSSISVQLFPFADTPNPGNEYKVWVTLQEDYIPDTGNGFPQNSSFGFVPSLTKTDNFKVHLQTPTGFAISGKKFYDAKLNGDSSQTGISNWQISIAGPSGFDGYTTTTDGNGHFEFDNLASGTYGLCEVLPAGTIWVPTTPTGISGIAVGPDSTGNNFGNVCLGAGGGLTLGFWSNKNGQNLILVPYLCTLDSLNLRNASGGNFDPLTPLSLCPTPTSNPSLTSTQINTAKTALKNWLLSATATNMAYMLSAQLATMQLNVLAGFVDGTANIYAPNTTSANAFGFATVNAIISEANSSLGANGSTPAGNPQRSHQEALKNALDNANNNKNFVQPSACEVNYNGTETCVAVP